MFKLQSPRAMWHQFRRDTLCPVTLEKLLTGGWRVAGIVTVVAGVLLFAVPVNPLAKFASLVLTLVGIRFTFKLGISSLRLAAGKSDVDAESRYVFGPLPSESDDD